jgi:DNA-binding NtrC family response regulator
MELALDLCDRSTRGRHRSGSKTWPIKPTHFDGFSELASVRVTGCSTLPQTRQICAADPPHYLIIDMALLENEPMDLITLANLSDCQSHIVALTDHPVFEIGARFGKARLTFLQKPVSAHDLLLLLRLRIIDAPEEHADVC